jgi:hypothetical protein
MLEGILVHLPFMRIRCRQCGASNHAENFSCLVCGADLTQAREAQAPPEVSPEAIATLAEPPAAVVTEPPVEAPIEDPSALVAAAEESNELAEDVRGLFPRQPRREPSRSHLTRYLLSGVLVLLAAAAGWHWRETHILANRLASKPPSQQSASPMIPSPRVASGTVQPDRSVAQAPKANPSQDEASIANVPAVVPPSTEVPPATSRRASRRSKVRIQPTAEVTRTLDPQETDGEKYLNGDGVPVDCDRAQKDLLAAARHSKHSSVKADRALGKMYATGHCVIRDLPLAYRWLARAQRQNRRPDTKLAADMKNLWSQMSPEERTLAMR